MKYLIHKVKASVSRREKTADGYGHKTVPDGFIIGTCSVTLDETSVLRMAERALRAKGRKCVGGPVTVKVVESQRVKP